MAPLPRALLQPLLLPPARVHRVYRGGALLERWLGLAEPADGSQPEAWFGAVNAARNTGGPAATEGIGTALLPEGWQVDGAALDGHCAMPALLAAYPEAILGSQHVHAHGATTGILFKVLDSAMRLTVQVHPDQAFAAQHFRSPYGKEECWLVLATRDIDGEAPHVYLGFQDALDRATLRRLVAAGDVPAILASLHKLAVHPGDVYYVPAGTPHAIGPGLLIAEVQEPTDFTISFDRHFGGVELADERRFLGLALEQALAAVRQAPLSAWSLEHLHRASNPGAVQMSGGDGTVAPRAPAGAGAATQTARPAGGGSQDRFWIDTLTVGADDQLLRPAYGTPAIGIVVGGSGTLSSSNGRELSVRQGQGFLLPAALGDWQAASGGIGLRLIVCGPHPAGVTGTLGRG
jgi:mannose-6-phosphate isomerase